MDGTKIVLKDQGEKLSWQGCAQLSKATGGDTEGRLSVSRIAVASNFPFPPVIQHAEDRFFYVVEGLLNFTAGDQALRAATGALVTIPRGTPYTLANTGKAAAAVVMLSTPAEGSTSTTATTLQPHVLRPGAGKKVSVAGDVYTLKIGGGQTSNAFAMFEFHVPTGGGPPPHIHSREDEAFYILEGELRLDVDGQSIIAPQGSFVIACKGSKHFFRNDAAAPARTLTLVWPAGFENFLFEAGQEVDERDPAAIPMTPEALHKMVEVASKYGIQIFPPAS